MLATPGEGRPLEATLRHIVLCADDYGIAPGVNTAIRDLILNHRLNATSVMVASPHFHRSDAASLALLNTGQRRVEIGLHLTLTAPFKPLSGAFAPAKDGAFLPLPAMIRLGLMHRLDRRAIEAEIDAQFAAFGRAFDRPPDFVDGHQHMHLLPQVREGLLRAMQRFCPEAWVRQCGGKPLRQLMGDRKGLFIGLLSRAMRRRAAAFGIACNPTFSGTYDFADSADFQALFPGFLDGQEDGGVVMCHPGFPDEALRQLDPLTDLRAREHAYLSGNDFPRILAGRGYALR